MKQAWNLVIPKKSYGPHEKKRLKVIVHIKLTITTQLIFVLLVGNEYPTLLLPAIHHHLNF